MESDGVIPFPGGGPAERKVRRQAAAIEQMAARLLTISAELGPELRGAALVAAAAQHIVERTGNADAETLVMAEIKWKLEAKRYVRANPENR